MVSGCHCKHWVRMHNDSGQMERRVQNGTSLSFDGLFMIPRDI